MEQFEKIKEKLAAPFPSKEVKFRVGMKSKNKTTAMALAYIDARAVSKRLDDVVGIENWESKLIPQYEMGEIKGFICELTVYFGERKITRSDFGYLSSEDNPKAKKSDSIKGAASDALKRAAVHFGIGRYLYEIESPWLPLASNGFSFQTKPRLPDFALPEEERGQYNNQNGFVNQPVNNPPPQPVVAPAPQGAPAYVEHPPVQPVQTQPDYQAQPQVVWG